MEPRDLAPKPLHVLLSPACDKDEHSGLGVSGETGMGAPEPTGVLPSAVHGAPCSGKMQDWVTVRNLRILKGWHKLKEKDQTKPVCSPIQLMAPRPHLKAVAHPWLGIWEGHQLSLGGTMSPTSCHIC